jgi:cellulose biosynthesis protein BcsQ
MGVIVTFYSYKGGVGRSMGLANIAVLLAQRGQRVLVIDWDLEAPGVERYFSGRFKFSDSGGGLIRLLLDASTKEAKPYTKYLCRISENGARLSLLTSGREQDPLYAKHLEEFDWNRFFAAEAGGAIFERLRSQWKDDFDFVLIDSRTGLSDIGGVCTILLPDIIVAMFTANYQSLYGTRDVMRLAQQARQKLAHQRMALTVLPLPARFGTRGEFREAREWIIRFEEAFAEFFDDWLPMNIRPRDILEQIKIPQMDYFGFGERLAVIEQGTNDPERMGFVYNKVARLLQGQFANLEEVFGIGALERLSAPPRGAPPPAGRQSIARSDPPISDDYQFDVFVSYAKNPLMDVWLRDMITLLDAWLEETSGPVRIFFDVKELEVAPALTGIVENALRRSKMLLALVSPQYLVGKWTMAECNTFVARERMLSPRRSIIVAVMIQGGDRFPTLGGRARKWGDLRQYAAGPRIPPNSPVYFRFHKSVVDLAEIVGQTIAGAPPFNREWPVVPL